MMDDQQKQSASFRDPSGFLFWKDGVLYRQINKVFAENYDLLMRSGLYGELTKRGMLISHEEVFAEGADPVKDSGKSHDVSAEAYKVIRPEVVKFISYPYEWCFSELRDAALLTLKIQKIAMEFGMSLRDASAYNIQFHNGRPVLIDTLSFEKYEEGKPWIAYRQFCQHFLAPLALMSYRDLRLGQLSKNYIDGIPLDLASALLPWKTNLKPGLLFHIHLHAKSQKRFASKKVPSSGKKVGSFALLGILESLGGAVRGLKIKLSGTEWGDYYEATNYSNAAMENKKKLVVEFLEKTKPETVWDLGANDGMFGRLASDKGIFTAALDIDPVAVQKNYLRMREAKEKNMLPLISDLTNPAPGIGWANEERMSLADRGPADLAMALALVHHLAISNNLPFPNIASFFSRLCKFLIVEFIPKDDSQVQRLLRNREDIFSDYKKDIFERDFQKYFTIKESHPVEGSKRTLYLMEKK